MAVGFEIGVRSLAAVAACLAVAALPLPGAAAAAQVPDAPEQIRLSFAPLVKKAAPAVVNIYARRVVRERFSNPLFDDPFFRRFFGEGLGPEQGVPRQRVENSLGSGVIVRPEGVIVTNHHVVDGADEIRVVLADRRELAATVIIKDARTDLAFLKVDAEESELPSIEIKDSDELEVGDLVLAIGNPFGVGQTVTSGIVSALARTRIGVSDLNFFIQTDAAINPGNSGGALLAMDGKLVGINTAIFSKTGGSHGVGFAIPSNMVRSVMAGLTSGGRVVRPWLGARGQGVSADIAATLGLPRPAGVLIKEIHPAAGVAKAGLKVGDVVLAVNGHEVNDADALKYRIATLTAGDTASLGVWRRGETVTLRVALLPPPQDPPSEATEIAGPTPFAGATVDNLSPALAEELGLDTFRGGVIVLAVRPASAADRVRFQPGDIVQTINGEYPKSVAHFKGLLARKSDQWRIAIDRKGKILSLVINR